MPNNPIFENDENNEIENRAENIEDNGLSVFPMLANYKAEHKLNDFRKLCIEIVEFCRQVYASTTSEEERRVYRDMAEKIQM